MIARRVIVSARATWPAWHRRLAGLAAHDAGMTAALVAVLALYYMIPQPELALPLLLVYAALVWLRLDLAICLLPVAFPYWYVPKRVTAHAVFPLSEIALGICAGVALVRVAPSLFRARGRERLARRLRLAGARMSASGHVTAGRPYGWLLMVGIAGFVVAGALGVVVARRPHEALRDFRWEIIEPLVYLLLVLVYARGPQALRRLVWALLGSALALATLAVVQIAFAHVTFAPLAQGNRLVPLVPGADGAYRATAFVYGSGNSLGAYVERALPLALALSLASGLKRWERLAAGALCLAYLPALYWSASRGAWIAAAVAVLVVVCFVLGRPWLLGVLAALAGVVALWQRNGLVAAALAGHNGSGTERTLVWLAAWHMIRDHPVLGIGLDQFLYSYSNLYTTHPYWITVLNGHPTIAWREPNLAQPHNLLLDLWLSTGLLGLLAFVAILAAFWARCLRLWRVSSRAAPARTTVKPGAQRDAPASAAHHTRDAAWVRAVALGLGASMIAAVAHGMVDSAYFVPDLALILWFSVATLVVAEGVRSVGRKNG